MMKTGRVKEPAIYQRNKEITIDKAKDLYPCTIQKCLYRRSYNTPFYYLTYLIGNLPYGGLREGVVGLSKLSL